MALQLVYTSAPKLLDAGRSGFGVVARSKNLPPLAANAIERFSKFANMQGTDRSRIVMAHRKVTIGNTRLHVLSRIRDSGSDHTGRTNHIAHHLIFSPLEIRQALAQRLTPADVLVQFAWLDRWEGAPKAYDGSADIQIGSFLPHYAATDRAAWAAATGEPLHSRLLASDGAPKSGALIIPDGLEMPQLLGEALAECQNPWEKTFTISLEPTDELAELDWVIAYRSDASAISRVSSRAIFDISRPHDLPVPVEAVQPLPDLRSAASLQETPPTIHGQASPQHAYSLRPIHAQPNPATRREEPESRPTAVINSRRTGNGKLWLIIGSGIAALFLLAMIILIYSGNTKPEQPSAKADISNDTTELIEKLVKEGELEDYAKIIATLQNVDQPVLKALPSEMATLREDIKKLGTAAKDPVTSDTQLQNFITETVKLKGLDLFPKGSLCYWLWKSRADIHKLHVDENPTEKPVEVFGELKLSLESVSNITEWPDATQIKRIYLILWERKYLRIVEDLVEGKRPVTVKAVEELMDSKKSGDQEMITDEELKAIHDRLGKEKLQKYAAKLSPELRKKFLLPEVKAIPENKTTPNTPPTTKEEKPPAPSIPELVDEEWCVIDPNKSGSFQIDLPKSKIIPAIRENGDPGEASYQGDVSYAFGDERFEFKDFNADFIIELQGTSLKCDKPLPPAWLQKTLSIKYKNKKLVLHFVEWPDSAITESHITATSKRVPNPQKNPEHAFLYEITLEGKGLSRLAAMRDKTIPKAQLYCGDLMVGESSERIVHNLPPEEKEVESPTEEIKNTLKQIVDQVSKKTAEEKKKQEGNKGNKGKLEDSDYKDIWEEVGEKILDDNPETKKWLEERLAKEANKPKIKDIDKIDGDLSINEKVFLSVIGNPNGKFFRPNLPAPITFELRVDGKACFTHKLTVQPAP
jgi:hypothetical protein